jgi:hypothetical protein
MAGVKWEVEARIYMHGFLVVAGTLHKTDSDLMFIANARPRFFRNVRWSIPLSEVLAIRELQRCRWPVVGFLSTNRVDIQTRSGSLVIWVRDPGRLVDDPSWTSN